jgi:hypothetical protein
MQPCLEFDRLPSSGGNFLPGLSAAECSSLMFISDRYSCFLRPAAAPGNGRDRLPAQPRLLSAPSDRQRKPRYRNLGANRQYPGRRGAPRHQALQRVARRASVEVMDFSIPRITSGRGTSVLVPQSNSREDFRSVYGFIELG